MGKLINGENREHIKQIYITGCQRQRKAAALELALLDAHQFLLNYAAKESAGYE